ncbi:MAG: cytidylate kinase family protein [Bacteroidales bacterium]
MSGLSEMIMAVSGNFVSDMKVKKVVRDVILSICKEGYAVLVGRGGSRSQDQLKSHCTSGLVAPFYWRVENIMHKKNMDIEEAEEFVVDTDENRRPFLRIF